VTPEEEDRADITLAILLGAFIRQHHGEDPHLWKWYFNGTEGFGWKHATEADASRAFLTWYRSHHRTIKP
jgi:hypothetical protein